MIYRKLTSDNDYTFGTSNDFYEGTDAVSQAIYTNLKLLMGEWWEDTSQGLPLFQNILGTFDAQAVDLLIKSCINGVQGVQGISDFTSNYSNRTYSMSCTVQTQYGDATIKIVF